MAVLDDIGNAGRRPGVILKDAELTLVVAHDIRAADMNVNTTGNVQPDHFFPVIRIAENKVRRHDTVLQDFPVVIDVLQEMI